MLGGRVSLSSSFFFYLFFLASCSDRKPKIVTDLSYCTCSVTCILPCKASCWRIGKTLVYAGEFLSDLGLLTGSAITCNEVYLGNN